MKMKKRSIIILILCLIILTAVSFLNSAIFKNIVRKTIIKAANKNLVAAELSIGKVKGSLLSNIALENLELSTQNEQIFTCKEISINYKILPLLKKKLIINDFKIQDVDLLLTEQEPGSWNFSQILPPTDSTKIGLQQTEINWQIELKNLQIVNLNAVLNLIETGRFIPQKISDLNLTAEASYKQNELSVNLTTFSLQSSVPNITIRDLGFTGKLQDSLLVISDLKLQTIRNEMSAKTSYDLNSGKLLNLQFELQPLDLYEFTNLFSELPLRKYPLIFLKLVLENDEMNSDIKLQINEQTISLESYINSIYHDPEYKADLKFAKINMADWLKGFDVSTDLNLEMELAGKGTELQGITGFMKLNSTDSYLGEKRINTLLLLADKNKDSANLDLKINSPAGSVNLKGRINKLFAVPEFDLSGSAEKLNLSEVTGNKDNISDLNFNFDLKGSGLSRDELKTGLKLSVTTSSYGEYNLNTLNTDFYYANKNYDLNNFSADAMGISINAAGKGALEGDHEIAYSLNSYNLKPLQKYFLIGDISGSVELKGSVKGTISNLKNTTNLQLNNFSYNNMSLDSLIADVALNKQVENIEFSSEINAHDFKINKFDLNKIELISSGNLNTFRNELVIVSDSLKLTSKSKVILDSIFKVELPYLLISAGNQFLETEHDSAMFRLKDNDYYLENFSLINESGAIRINGYYNPVEQVDMHIGLAGIDLRQINGLHILPMKIGGILDFDSKIKGSLQDPEINADLIIQDPQMNEYLLKKITADLMINNNLLNSEFQIIRSDNEQVLGLAQFPVDLMPDNDLISPTAPFKVDLMVNDLDLRFMDNFTTQFENINGILNLDFSVYNTLQDPEFKGNVNLRNGSIIVPRYGIDYNKMKLNSIIIKDTLFITEFFLKGGEGNLTVSGHTNLKDLIANENSELYFHAQGDNFLALNKKKLQLLTDFDVNINGSADYPIYGGQIDILRAKINLDELKGNNKNVKNTSEPLLVQALTINSDEGPPKKAASGRTSPDMIKNLTGKIKVNIPRNTWITDKNMNIELSGDLEILKTGSYFEVFGFITTRRGNYTIYGRKFNLVSGQISFNGGEEMNPYLDITVSHIFRDANKLKRIMQIHLTGYSLNPEIRFILDEEAISEADAVSYLLFGKSNNEISQNEKTQVSEFSQTDFAKSLLTKEIGSRISEKIANKLNLNVIEYSGGTKLKQGSFLIGKYITNNLFLSYQKEFSLGQSKEIVPDKVALEYEISKHFSLEAFRGDEKSTGVDVYWKFIKQ
ncbi:MAG: translocation/assembly module TamB [Candidatus Cloacimonetes bacterium]|nr:translocation/assembly module TamB [Candidatus Cloacimonadota bacterium]